MALESGGHSLAGGLGALHLATVSDTRDPEGRGRVRVRLAALDVELWAPLLVASAGNGYGVACLPKNGEIVAVGFVGPDLPLVLGSLWSGGAPPQDGADPAEERYSVKTPAGTELRFDDADGPQLLIETPAGQRVLVTDGEGGQVRIEVGGNSITVDSDSIALQASSEVTVNAGQVKVSAGMLSVEAGMSKFSGVVKCDTLISNAVVSSSYTPGAGNIW
ncbi:phage baseplate assembly protein V [Plasticicumulans acidivorans]|uniref:Gp5/Type VI secretion system Vgr protein OB-fold domain-containing protein n=1 Tax=Plasticicumulans acidivorans TaxID=886464 RepID=A0A317N0X6_9GAMM|nr:phage baseplate assembly protein V [Plasticicumulans acidivorans]PWV65784.1 hypothetical protein C7443_101269 [Plasticicumulans acidivorans]